MESGLSSKKTPQFGTSLSDRLLGRGQTNTIHIRRLAQLQKYTAPVEKKKEQALQRLMKFRSLLVLFLLSLASALMVVEISHRFFGG